MACARGPNIDDIDDMMEVAELMKNLGLSAKGLKTLDEIKAKVKEHLHKNPVKDILIRFYLQYIIHIYIYKIRFYLQYIVSSNDCSQ